MVRKYKKNGQETYTNCTVENLEKADITKGVSHVKTRRRYKIFVTSYSVSTLRPKEKQTITCARSPVADWGFF